MLKCSVEFCNLVESFSVFSTKKLTFQNFIRRIYYIALKMTSNNDFKSNGRKREAKNEEKKTIDKIIVIKTTYYHSKG